MRNFTFIVPALALALIACETPEPVEHRDGGSSTGDLCPEPPPVQPPAVSGCACDPGKPDTCGVGLDCVPVGDEYACLAPCFGENEFGGGYVTSCNAHQQEVACFQPYPDRGPSGPSYCPACLTCGPVDPKSLVCQ